MSDSREVWIYGPTESGYSLGIRRKKVKVTPRTRRAGTPRKRRVFKGAAGFSKKRLDPMTMMPVLWRYLYPDAFDPLPPVPVPPGLEEEGRWDRSFLGLDYDPRLLIPLDDLWKFLRDEIINDEAWIEWAVNCHEHGEPAAHPVYEVHPVEGDHEQFFRDVVEQFRLPTEWLKNGDDTSVYIHSYFNLLSEVINEIKPEDLVGWFEFGYNDFGGFGLWYYDCRDGA